jgi:hypothetical protein
MTPDPAVPWDRDARPSLDEVLALRADRMQTVRRVIESLTEEKLGATPSPSTGRATPTPAVTRWRNAWERVLNEEWEHRLYAERDLDVLGC